MRSANSPRGRARLARSMTLVMTLVIYWSKPPVNSRGFLCLSRLGLRALAQMRQELALPEPDGFWRYLDQLIILDIGDGLLQRHRRDRCQANGFVFRGGADIGELLGAQRIDVEIVVLGVLADDHALIDFRARHDEKPPALFQIPERIGHRLAFACGDEHAVAPAFDRPLVRRVGMKHPVDDAGAARVGEEFAVVADEAAGGRKEHKPRLAGAGGPHVLKLALAVADLLYDDAGIGI